MKKKNNALKAVDVVGAVTDENMVVGNVENAEIFETEVSNEEAVSNSETVENAIENENLETETEVHSGVSGQSDDEAKIEDVEPIAYQEAVAENPESESEKSENTAEVHNDVNGQADNKVEPFRRDRRQKGLGSVYPITNRACCHYQKLTKYARMKA